MGCNTQRKNAAPAAALGGNEMATTPTPFITTASASRHGTAAIRTSWPPEINQYTIKFLIGLVALLLPLAEVLLSRGAITSISESYWYPDSHWSRNVFVGSLFAIAALLASYNGTSSKQLWFGKFAALAAILIANFPCECGNSSHEIVKGVHGLSAGVLFAVLAWFCWDFIQRAKTKLHDVRRTAARRRIVIYEACGVGMLAAIALFVAHFFFFPEKESLILWGETFGLVSFGLSWLTASHKLPVITHPSERESVVGVGGARPG
jgi:hypothetical protein